MILINWVLTEKWHLGNIWAFAQNLANSLLRCIPREIFALPKRGGRPNFGFPQILNCISWFPVIFHPLKAKYNYTGVYLESLYIAISKLIYLPTFESQIQLHRCLSGKQENRPGGKMWGGKSNFLGSFFAPAAPFLMLAHCFALEITEPWGGKQSGCVCFPWNFFLLPPFLLPVKLPKANKHSQPLHYMIN